MNSLNTSHLVLGGTLDFYKHIFRASESTTILWLLAQQHGNTFIFNKYTEKTLLHVLSVACEEYFL